MKILYFDMDNVLVDFKTGLDYMKSNHPDIYNTCEEKDNIPNLFKYMLPIEGAIEAFNILSKHYDVYILSTSPWDNITAASDKIAWVKKYLGDVAKKRVILTHHINLAKGDYLIDDRLKHGVDKFEGEHIHFGTSDFPNWCVVVKYLINKENL